MDLTKEALCYISENAIRPQDRILEMPANESAVVIDDNGNAKRLDPQVYLAKEPIEISTLSGLVDYIKSNLDISSPKILQISDEQKILLKGQLEVNGERELLAMAIAIIPRFNFNTPIDVEQFNIALQSKFVENSDRDILLKVIGNLTEDSIRTTGDDGVSQAVTIKQGIATAADVKVPNPVTLAPYRTFIEVEQPESKFIFRMSPGPEAAIYEADGGAWRIKAIQNIKDYLQRKLQTEVDSGMIVILA